MAQNNIKDTTHLLVYGHEGWLEEYPSHYHLGDPIMVKMQWGHNLAVDGLPNKDYLKHHIYALRPLPNQAEICGTILPLIPIRKDSTCW